MDFLIVGTGPVGAITALYLLKEGHRVTILEIASDKVELIEDFPELNENFLKSDPTGSIGAYDKNQVIQIKDLNKRREWFTSKASFGFSNVWGGTWDRFNTLKGDSHWQNAYDLVEKLISESELFINEQISSEIQESSCNCLDEIKVNFDRWQSEYKMKNVNFFKTQINGKIKNNVFYPWSSKNLIEYCKTFESFAIFEGQIVKRIDESQEKCMTITNSGQYLSDKVVLAAGPVGNIPIILNSCNSIQTLTLQDTPLIHFPLFSLKPLKKRTNPGHKYSHFSMRILDSRDSIGSYIQFYPHADQYELEITYGKNRLITFFLCFLIKILKRFLIIGLVYLKTDNFNEVIISKSNTEEITCEIGNLSDLQIPEFKDSISHLLKKLKLYPIWKFMKINQIGSSYHLANVKEIENFSNFGTLVSNENIGVAGSFALTKLEPGPITFTAMAHGLLLGNYIAKLPKL